jgi:hypothetical protein
MLEYWLYATHKNIFIFLIKKHYLSQQLNANITAKACKTSWEPVRHMG